MEENFEPDYPVILEARYPRTSSRWLALATILFVIPKMIMLIPHFIILYFLGIATLFAWIFGQFGVLFTGRYPRAIYDFVLGVMRWQVRINAYLLGLTDKYPPFSLR